MARKKGTPTVRTLSDEAFQALVNSNSSIRDILVELGYHGHVTCGRGAKDVVARIKELNLATDHFDERNYNPLTTPPELVLIEKFSGHKSMPKTAFYNFKCVPYCCSVCTQGDMWNNKPLTLIFDHINGNNRDNRSSNLRWLCPNCDTQQSTFAGRNKRNPLKSGVR